MIPNNAIAVLGGSFNPVHIGHVRLAEEVQKRCRFSALWLVPNQNPPHKPAYEISSEHRLEMVKLAFNHVPNSQVSTFELENSEPSYAIRTIEYFTRQNPGAPIFFVMGADAFYDLPHWYAFPDVMEACSYIIVKRAGWEETKLDKRLSQLVEARLLAEESVFEPFQKVFRTRSGTRVCVFDVALPEVSSTEVRLRIQLGESIRGLVPEAVERYLKTLQFYGTQKA